MYEGHGLGKHSTLNVIHSARRGLRGVTLLELMVVVAIVGIMSAMAGVAFQTMQMQERVFGEVRRMVGRLQELRAASVTTGDCHGVLIGGGNETQYAGLFSNRIVTFRKTVGGCGPFVYDNMNALDPTKSDRIITNTLQGEENRDGLADQARAGRMQWHIVWDANGPIETELQPNDVVQIIFDARTGRPTLYYSAGNPAASPRTFMSLRLLDSCPNVPDATNPCQVLRRFEISETGNTQVSQKDY